MLGKHHPGLPACVRSPASTRTPGDAGKRTLCQTPPPGWKCWQAWSAVLEAGLQVIGGPPLPLAVAVRFPMHLTMRCVKLQSPDAQHACAARGASQGKRGQVGSVAPSDLGTTSQWHYRSAKELPSTLCNADDVISQWREGGGVGVTYIGIAGVSSAPSDHAPSKRPMASLPQKFACAPAFPNSPLASPCPHLPCNTTFMLYRSIWMGWTMRKAHLLRWRRRLPHQAFLQPTWTLWRLCLSRCPEMYQPRWASLPSYCTCTLPPSVLRTYHTRPM